MRLSELFEGIAYRHATDSNRCCAHLEITDVIISPETGCENALFVAVNTGLCNTRYQMSAAFARGCRVFLCEYDAAPGEGATVLIAKDVEKLLGLLAARVFGHPSRYMSVIGVTGSTGKSSVISLAAHALQKAGFRVATLGSDGFCLQGKHTPPTPIVPDAAGIQRMLATMKDAGSEVVLLELSSYQLSHFAANGIDFLGVLLTNLTPRHIGGKEHASFAEYRAAKEELMRAKAAFAILPTDVEMQTHARAWRVGEGGEIYCEGVREGVISKGIPHTCITLAQKEEKYEITLPVVGDIAKDSVLFAFALCRALGLEGHEIAAALCACRIPCRMELVAHRAERLAYLDAAFLPQDLANALQALRPLAKGRLCVLLGSVGGRAKERRAPLAQTAERYADLVYLTADDPDLEDPEEICLEMRAAMHEPERARVVPDREAAIRLAVSELRRGDVLLVIAKPVPHTQLVCGIRRPFMDAALIKSALRDSE